MDSFRIELGLGPPSVNNYVRHTKRGGHYKTQKTKDFISALQWHLVTHMPKGWNLDGKSYSVSILYHGRIEVDNAPKTILDGLQGYAYHNDRVVDELIVRRIISKERKTEILVTLLA